MTHHPALHAGPISPSAPYFVRLDIAMSAIPQGYHSVTPSLTVHDGAAALDFYVRAFGAVEVFRMPHETDFWPE